MDDIVSVTLFRHGITRENIEKRYIGWTDVTIDMASLESVAMPDLTKHYQQVFSSDLKRCTETAQLLVPSAAVIKDPRLRELHFGDWEQKTYNDLKAIRAYRMWLENPFQEIPPNGEAFGDFEQRVMQCWDEIMTMFEVDHCKNILIITHGGPIRLLLTKYSPKKVNKSWWDWNIEHFSGYTLTWNRQELIKGGNLCTSSLVEPFMARKGGL